MLKYSIKRVILAFVTAFIILTLTFFLVKSLPSSKVIATDKNVIYAFYMNQVKLGYCTVIEHPAVEEWVPTVTPLDRVVIGRTEYFFYTTPIIKQYFSWIGNIVTKWDWGTRASPSAIPSLRSALTSFGGYLAPRHDFTWGGQPRFCKGRSTL